MSSMGWHSVWRFPVEGEGGKVRKENTTRAWDMYGMWLGWLRDLSYFLSKDNGLHLFS